MTGQCNLGGPRRFRVLRSETGAASVFAAFAMLALLSLTVLCVQVGGAIVAKHRAQSAADLAALAAAAALSESEDACEAARQVASVNGARLGGCTVEGSTVVVRAAVALPVRGLPGPGEAVAVARGGWQPG